MGRLCNCGGALDREMFMLVHVDESMYSYEYFLLLLT